MGPRSKGCESCKRRKVKCDETHPQCTRCCKAGIACTGFAPRLKFVDEGPRIRRSMAVSHAQFHEFSAIKRNSYLAYHSSRTRCYQLSSPALLLPNTLPLTAFKDDIFISYLFFKLFGRDNRHSWNAEAEADCGIPTDWIPELVQTSQRPRQKSWEALAAIFFGQAHNNHGVMISALKLYGQALSELRNKLSNPDDCGTDSTLASMTALYMYEILTSKTEKGWMSHADGLGWLLEWRGPYRQKSLAGKSIFLEHRIMIIAKSIISRQSTFLRTAIWKTLPWEDNPASKTTIDYLIDIGTDIAEYIAQISKYISKSGQEFEYSQLRTQVAASLEELNAWWRQWEADHAQPAIEVASHQVAGELLFLTILEYDMPWTAFTICNYNAMRILLLQLWHMLQPMPIFGLNQTINEDVLLDVPNSTPLLGITSNVKGLACEILRSLKYSYRKCRRIIFTSSFFFLQDTAYGCFDQDSKEAIWISRHGWADSADSDNIEDKNLLRGLLPFGRIRAETSAWA